MYVCEGEIEKGELVCVCLKKRESACVCIYIAVEAGVMMMKIYEHFSTRKMNVILIIQSKN